MAKRTPRSEAPDVTNAPARPRRGDESSDQRAIDPGSRPEALNAGAPADSESTSDQPSADDIRLRAYHRYLERGGGHGMDFEDWLEAERELKTKR